MMSIVFAVPSPHIITVHLTKFTTLLCVPVVEMNIGENVIITGLPMRCYSGVFGHVDFVFIGFEKQFVQTNR